MENNKSYFGEVGSAVKTLCVGLKTTLKEYFTPKSTEQYPENRKTTLHVAKRHRGRLVFKRNEDGSFKCTACTLCEKSCPNGSTTLATACSASCAPTLAILMPLSLQTISRTPCSTAMLSCSISTRRFIRAVRFPTSLTVAHQWKSVSLTRKRSNKIWLI